MLIVVEENNGDVVARAAWSAERADAVTIDDTDWREYQDHLESCRSWGHFLRSLKKGACPDCGSKFSVQTGCASRSCGRSMKRSIEK